jgi:hypothetical protein
MKNASSRSENNFSVTSRPVVALQDQRTSLVMFERLPNDRNLDDA